MYCSYSLLHIRCNPEEEFLLIFVVYKYSFSGSSTNNWLYTSEVLKYYVFPNNSALNFDYELPTNQPVYFKNATMGPWKFCWLDRKIFIFVWFSFELELVNTLFTWILYYIFFLYSGDRFPLSSGSISDRRRPEWRHYKCTAYAHFCSQFNELRNQVRDWRSHRIQKIWGFSLLLYLQNPSVGHLSSWFLEFFWISSVRSLVGSAPDGRIRMDFCSSPQSCTYLLVGLMCCQIFTSPFRISGQLEH